MNKKIKTRTVPMNYGYRTEIIIDGTIVEQNDFPTTEQALAYSDAWVEGFRKAEELLK